MAEPPLKKQKLTRDWFLEQLQGLELNEDLKKSVAEYLASFPESDLSKTLSKTSIEQLVSLLEQKISDETKRAVVSLRMQQRFQSEFAPAPVVPEPDPPDPLCQWLDETVERTPKPSEWKADEVPEFSNCILGDPSMKYKLIVRQCYKQMHAQIMTWLQDKFSLTTPPIGMFVITGTPGIGKSVFLAYMVAFLVENRYGIVIQRGQKFWSRQSGSGKTVAHEEQKPFQLLKNSQVVLLADPLGSETATEVEHRFAGCTIVFTSLRERCYKASYKQQSPYSLRRYMPIWSREELVKHREVLFPTYEEKDVIDAHALLGGSVRWLADLVNEQGQIPDQSQSKVAQRLIAKYLSITSFEDLNSLLQHFENPQNAEDRAHSKMSYLLQIHADPLQQLPFEEPTVRLIDSKVAVQVICDRLNLKTEEEQKKFVAQYLGAKPLGSLVGQVFQSFVLECLTGKGKKKYDLHGKCLGSAETFKVEVPNQRKELQTEAAGATKEPLAAAQLYHPLADNFPAADFFFLSVVSEEYTLWLLQTTKADKHDCKIGKMREGFEKHFDKASLEKVSTIKWVIVAPSVIASNYTKPQTVHGEWKIDTKVVNVKQCVSSWKVSP
eukprot:symbB.v1.2.007162.t1/scaffold437.1/size205459/1